MARKIVITSGKGGVGKTSVCANLGYSLAKLKKRVLLVDVDIGLNNLDVVMGVENKVVFDLIDVLEGKCRPKQALIRDFDNYNLYILPSVHSLNYKKIDAFFIKNAIDEMEESFDYILIDCPAGLDIPFERAVFLADEALIVSTPHISSLRDADKTLKVLSSKNINILGLVVNRVRGDMVINKEMLDPIEISKAISLPLIGILPEDDNISINGVAKQDCGSSSFAFELLAKKLEYGEEKLYDYTKGYKGLWNKIKYSLIRRA